MGNIFERDDVLLFYQMTAEAQDLATRSAIPNVSQLTSEEVRQAIIINKMRCDHMGYSSQLYTNPNGTQAEEVKRCGQWRIDYTTNSRRISIIQFSGTHDHAKPIYVFVDELLFLVREFPERFSFEIKGYDKIEPGVAIAMFSGGMILRYNGKEDFFFSSCEEKLNHSTLNLRDAIMSGKFLTKKYRLRRSPFFDENLKLQIVEDYCKLRDTLKSMAGYELFITHGALLGMIRAGDFIQSDDDFDCAYVSKYTNVDDVARERLSLLRKLRDKGINCKMGFTGHLKIKLSKLKLDVMPAWFEDGTFNVSGFTSISMKPKDVLPHKNLTYKGYKLLIPRNAEKFLQLNYGDNWRVPDPWYKTKKSLRAKANRNRLIPYVSPGNNQYQEFLSPATQDQLRNYFHDQLKEAYTENNTLR